MCSRLACLRGETRESSPSCLTAAASNEKGPPRCVLVGMDGSENAEDAFNWYLKDIFKPGDRVVVVFCPDLIHGLVEQMTYPCRDTFTASVVEARDRAESIQIALRDKLDRAGVKGSIHMTVATNPGQVLVQEAEREDACMIVIGCRGRGTIRRTVLGSVSAYVLHHSHVPVMVYPSLRTSQSL
ncbi:hypothetical protein RRG08_031073 [Elysia crispata]|uniref:UspA domain-containing protein n=1 Tax=Elysia crispata TaxID=231223 RepID=A0AAE0ZGD8_9GAST|nr:hypothetical protein RRG08_031073 [Elysia crispata]